MSEWLRFMGRNPEWWRRPEYQRGTVIQHKTLAEAAASTDPRVTADHRLSPRRMPGGRGYELYDRMEVRPLRRCSARAWWRPPC